MENEAVRRRLNMITAHFAPSEETVSGMHLLPLNCSSSLSSVIRRCDNRMYFARQASSCQSCFMRQASGEEVHKSSVPQYHNPPKCSGSMMKNFGNDSEGPLFSRPARVEPKVSCISANQQGEAYHKLPSIDLPKFARPDTRRSRYRQIHAGQKLYSSECSGPEWSPRSNVAEGRRSYVMTVELPGVDIKDIRVEINDENLIVSGQRSTIRQKMEEGSADSIFAYHKQEIFQGPYQVSWALPNNVNKDGVSAEFMDGLLRIIIPKL